MKNVESHLLEIIGYLDLTRQVGHTTAVLEGANNGKCIVLTHNQKFADHINKNTPATALSYKSKSLRGRRTPIVFDNAAIRDLLGDSLNLIEQLKESINERNEMIKEHQTIIKEQCELLKKNSEKMKQIKAIINAV